MKSVLFRENTAGFISEGQKEVYDENQKMAVFVFGSLYVYSM